MARWGRGLRRALGRPGAASPPGPSRPADAGLLERAGDVLVEALALREEERAALLERACAGEPELRREVESLLAAHGRPGPVDRPVARFAPPADADAAPAAGRTAGHYELRDVVGGGGMGVVYRAWDTRLGRAVALKFLHPELGGDPRAKERFRAEARAAAALDHPNICTIHEIGETADGQLFLAMPLYEGETLRARLARGPLPLAESVALARQVADGLAGAHERGIVHRDVKPANLMITADGVVKILDFGVAKLAHLALTRPEARPGTEAYMSPEQAAGEAVDGRADLWSLGAVLWEMLAGARLAEEGPQDAEAAADAAVRAAGVADPRLAGALARLLRRALARPVEARYATARELARDLAALLALAAGSGSAVAGPARFFPPAAPGSTSEGTLLPGGERRRATVAVCRLAGHAALLERLGPAEAERVMRRLREAADGVARRHGGVLQGAEGDVLTLLFGLPAAHEDDAMRAVRAALELQEEVPGLGGGTGQAGAPALRLAVGIDSAVVIAQPSTTPGRAFEVAGAAAQTALQLAGAAPAGEIWLSPASLRLVQGYVHTDPRPPLPLGDRERPLLPHALTGQVEPRTRLEAAQRGGALTPFTGRAVELERLTRQLEAARAGAGRFVTVVGDAGMGKSRLLHELRQRLDASGTVLLQGRCQAYGGGTAYGPFIEILRAALRLDRSGPGPEPAGAMEAAARLCALDDALEDFIPLYLHLLSIPAEEFPLPQHLRGEQFGMAVQEALAALLTVLSRRRTTVLLLEDWHWVDDASAAVLRQVAELVAEHALLVVATLRPGGGEEWSSASHHETLVLGPLAPDSTRAMLAALLRVSSVPDGLARLLHERTGGNPFFLEEVCQTLLEEGALRVDGDAVALAGSLEALDLPETVQAVIRARLDRLEPDAREVLRDASVVGREFTRAILERMVPDPDGLPRALQGLKAAGLVQQIRVLPEAAYRFKHALTQEVAYAGVLEHRRRELHGRAGTAIEELHAARLEDHLDRLAYHFSQAEDWDRAVRYAVQAASRASALAQFRPALATLERARTWLGRLPEDEARAATRVEILLREERLYETLGMRERQQRLIDELIARLEPAGEAARLAEVYVRQGDLCTLLRRFDAAEAALERSLRLRRGIGEPEGVRNTLRSLGLLRWHQRRDAEALTYVEEALSIDRAVGDNMAIVGDLSNLGYILKGLGELERARGYLLEGLELSRRIVSGAADTAVRGDVLLMQSYLLHNLANVHRGMGDMETGRAYLEEARRLTAGKRLPIQLSYHGTSLAHMALQAGRVEEALGHYRAAVDLTRRAGFVPGLVQSLRMLGEVLIGLGRRREALPHLREAAALFAQLKDADGEAAVWARLAGACEAEGQDAEAMAAWGQARSIRQRTGDAAGELQALEGLGRTARRHLPEASLAIGHFREAAELAASTGQAQAEGRLRNTLGILAWTRGEHAGALAEYERALAVFRAAGDEAGVGLALNSLGATLRALDRRGQARERLEQALAHHRQAGLARLEGHALALLGEIALELDEPAEARARLEASLAIRRRTGDRRGEGWMLCLLARAHAAEGRRERARRLAAAAAGLASEAGDVELQAACRALPRALGL